MKLSLAIISIVLLFVGIASCGNLYDALHATKPIAAMKDNAKRALGTCQKVTCAFAEDDSCRANTFEYPITQVVCVADNTFCDSSSQKCLKIRENGAPCDNNKQCKGSFCDTRGTSGSGGICMPLKDTGVNCTINAECASDTCKNRKCTVDIGGACKVETDCTVGACNGGKCSGLPAGSPCSLFGSSSLPCNDGLYCQVNSGMTTGICTAAAAIGGVCSSVFPCAVGSCFYGGSSTTTTNGVCVRRYTGVVGTVCSSSAACGDDLSCFNGRCLALTTKSSKAPCTDDSACTTQGETCECDHKSGNQICVMSENAPNPEGTSNAYAEAETCAVSKCGGFDDLVCVKDKCNGKVCDYVDKLAKQYKKQIQEVYPKCFDENTLLEQHSLAYFGCKSTSGAGVATIAIAAVVAAVAMLV